MKIKSSILVRLSTLIFVSALIGLGGCKTAQKTESGMTDGNNTGTTTENADTNPMGDSDAGRAMGLRTVHFPYDSHALSGEAKDDLKFNAQILKEKASLKIQIEGHCDIRGGIQYNIALGERRANAAKKYLEDLGVNSSRITTISYGKERPIDSGTSEEAHAKNRRGNFVITSR